MHTDQMPETMPQAQQSELEQENFEQIASEELSESSESLEESLALDPGLSNQEEPSEENEIEEEIFYADLSADELQGAIEAVLYMQHRPVSISKLRSVINPNIPEEEYRTAISNLMAIFFESNRGIELVEVAGGYLFRSKMEFKEIIRRLFQLQPMKLTNSMLEVLAIVAYNQPVTREGIDKIRGVDSSHLVRALLDKKMLRIIGKSDEVGKPMIYGTSREFLELFGLRDLGSLPSLRELEEMLPQNEVGAEISEEEALAKEMEGIVSRSAPLEFNDLELEDFEEAKTITEHDEKVAQENSNLSETINGSTENRDEASGDDDLPPEIAGRITPGQEGNA
ncbi:MAG: SMC-Scp complex subunit ScpB [Oligoflexia bacterium]|nr:SMC-Scp complex subunit ScpB [Oligoflexia bacterium]